MDNKILFAIIAAVVVVAAGSAAAIVVNNDDKGDDSGPEIISDYTLLDSTERIVPGLTVVTLEQRDSVDTEHTYFSLHTVKVNTVENGKVEYTLKSIMRDFDERQSMLDIIDFDLQYPPEGVTVRPMGDHYIINGQYEDGDFHYEFDNLKIGYLGEEIIFAEGTMNRIFVDAEDETSAGMLMITGTFTTEHGVIHTDFKLETYYTIIVPLNEFYSPAVVEKYDHEYDEFDSKTEKFENVDVTVYTVNYEIGEDCYRDYKVYVYGDYVLKKEGYYNDDRYAETFVFVDEEDEPDDSDFSILDSADNIKPGLAIERNVYSDDYTFFATSTVLGVKESNVTFLEEAEMSNGAMDGILVYLLLPFTLGDESTYIDGIVITKAGFTYTIDGAGENEDGSYEFEKLCITLDGEGRLVSASGWANLEIHTVEDDRLELLEVDAEFYMKEDEVLSDTTFTSARVETVAIGDYFETILTKYGYPLEGYQHTTSTEEIGDVEATLYVFDDNIGSVALVDYEVWVYNGYIIKECGYYMENRESEVFIHWSH